MNIDDTKDVEDIEDEEDISYFLALEGGHMNRNEEVT